MSISGFMGALGDAFGGYAQAQQADERKRQMADELKFKYANLDEGIADRQMRGREAIAGRQAIADENSKARTYNAQVRADERKYEADIRASDLATQRAINQYNATAGANKIVQVRRNENGNDIGITASGETKDLGFKSPAPVARGGNPQASLELKTLAQQQRAAASGVAQKRAEINDFLRRSGYTDGKLPTDPGAYAGNKAGEGIAYHKAAQDWFSFSKLAKQHDDYVNQHKAVSDRLQAARSGQMVNMMTQPPTQAEDSSGVVPDASGTPSAYDRFNQ